MTIKIQKQFIPKIKSRNDQYFTKYHPLWKTWPGTIAVSGDTSNRVNGTYRKLGCQQTIVLSALWRRDGTEDQPPMYLYLRPDVIRSGLDVAVFAPTPAYEDSMEICELHDWIPENALKESTHKTKASFLEWSTVPGNLNVEAPTPALSMVAQTTSFHQNVCAASEKDPSPAVLCEMSGLSKEVMRSLLECNESSDAKDVSTIDLTGRSGTRNAKRLSIIAAPTLLKYAAEDKLPISFSKWYRLASSSTSLGRCEMNVPPRPVEKWVEVSGRKYTVERVYDAEESDVYYQVRLKGDTFCH